MVARRTTQKSRSSFMTLPFCSNVDTFKTGCLGRADNWPERLPGSPGDASWHGLPAEKRNGGSVWTSGSYDPGLSLFYSGTGVIFRKSS